MLPSGRRDSSHHPSPSVLWPRCFCIQGDFSRSFLRLAQLLFHLRNYILQYHYVPKERLLTFFATFVSSPLISSHFSKGPLLSFSICNMVYCLSTSSSRSLLLGSSFHLVLAGPVRLFSRTPASCANNAFFASSGGIAANKSSLGPSRLGLKSRATSRHLTNSRSSSSFTRSINFVVVGAMPATKFGAC